MEANIQADIVVQGIMNQGIIDWINHLDTLLGIQTTPIDNDTRRIDHIEQSFRGIEGNTQLIQNHSLRLRQEIRVVQTELRGLQNISREASREAEYKREQNQIFLTTTREQMETMNEMLQGLDACLGAIQCPQGVHCTIPQLRGSPSLDPSPLYTPYSIPVSRTTHCT